MKRGACEKRISPLLDMVNCWASVPLKLSLIVSPSASLAAADATIAASPDKNSTVADTDTSGSRLLATGVASAPEAGSPGF